MAYLILVGLFITFFAIVGYFIVNKKSNGANELSWGKSLLTGFLVYIISLSLGALFTSIFQNTYHDNIVDFLENSFLSTFGFLFYSILYSFFLVLPALVLGLKFLSKTNLENTKKRLHFVLLSFVLVLIINVVMSDFLRNADFIVFLTGFSFFGIIVPWFFAKKVFN